MHRSKLIPMFLPAMLTGGLLFAQKVRIDYDHSVDFSKYRTYTWIKEPETTEDPFMEQRVIDAVNMQLAAKGLRLVNSDADLGLAVHVATQKKNTLETFYNGFGGGWGWGWGMGMGGVATTNVVTYIEGTIVADLFDSKTKKVVWRGVATKEHMSSKADKETKQTEKAIEKLFKSFPPEGL